MKLARFLSIAKQLWFSPLFAKSCCVLKSPLTKRPSAISWPQPTILFVSPICPITDIMSGIPNCDYYSCGLLAPFKSHFVVRWKGSRLFCMRAQFTKKSCFDISSFPESSGEIADIESDTFATAYACWFCIRTKSSLLLVPQDILDYCCWTLWPQISVTELLKSN